MGLFGLFGRKKDEDEEVDPADYAGMRLEIMDEQENLLFAARADNSWDGSMELRALTVPRLPPRAEYYPVLMRGYQVKTRKAVHMEGNITPQGNGVWSVEDLKITSKDNDRAFYRQETTVRGTVMPLRQRGIAEASCRLINVSAGGVCIQTAAEFMVGERFLLKSTLFEGWKPTPVMCAVRRVTRRKSSTEYGCEFIDLSPAIESAITRAIMDIQRERMRGGS